jgi:hypothetical protein
MDFTGALCGRAVRRLSIPYRKTALARASGLAADGLAADRSQHGRIVA